MGDSFLSFQWSIYLLLFICGRQNVHITLQYIKTVLCPSCRKGKIFLKKDFSIKCRMVLYIEINIFWLAVILIIKAKEVMQVCLGWDDKCNLNLHVCHSVIQRRGLTTFWCCWFLCSSKSIHKNITEVTEF